MALDMSVSQFYVKCVADRCLKESEILGTTLSAEVRAGITTFFTMAYIIAVNVSTATSTTAGCL